jgi:hypothetical protein
MDLFQQDLDLRNSENTAREDTESRGGYAWKGDRHNYNSNRCVSIIVLTHMRATVLESVFVLRH